MFEIERSFDKINFISIETIPAGFDKTNYSSNDFFEGIKNKTVYYRIKETDEQGRSYYSSIVSLPVGPTKNNFSLYPNPAKNSITLSGYKTIKEQVVFSLYNTEGKLIRKENWQLPNGSYSKTISIEDIAPGIYSIQLSGEEPVTIKFIKN
jgi:hypothetical protein